MPDIAVAPDVRAEAAGRMARVTRDLTGAPKPPAGRDHRVDLFRGLALVTIFVNHVPGTLYERFTSRNFGFSDAAEAFVLMSGIAAGLAYSNGFRAGPVWPAVIRIWSRVRQLYFVHLATTLFCLAIFAAAALWFGRAGVLETNNVPPVFARPLSAMIGIPLLGHQLGYLNILPLYVLLLLAAPALLPVAVRRPLVLLALSVGLWLAAGLTRFNIPAFPGPGYWFFNPLSWQLLFVVGLVAGTAMKTGEVAFPYRRPVFIAAAVTLVVIALWARVPTVGRFGQDMLGVLREWGAPYLFIAFDKAFLTLPRLVHALALAYVLASLAVMRTVSLAPWAEPFRMLGRNSLPVFATGTVIAIALQAYKHGLLPDPIRDGALLALGLCVQLGLAYGLETLKRRRAEAARLAAAA